MATPLKVRILHSKETKEVEYISFSDILAQLFPELKERSVNRLCLYWRKRNPAAFAEHLIPICFGGQGAKKNQLAFKPESTKILAQLVQESRHTNDTTGLADLFSQKVSAALLLEPEKAIQSDDKENNKTAVRKPKKLKFIPMDIPVRELPKVKIDPLSPIKMSDDFRNRLQARQCAGFQLISSVYDSDTDDDESSSRTISATRHAIVLDDPNVTEVYEDIKHK